MKLSVRTSNLGERNLNYGNYEGKYRTDAGIYMYFVNKVADVTNLITATVKQRIIHNMTAEIINWSIIKG
jgi:hypothetical protein